MIRIEEAYMYDYELRDNVLKTWMRLRQASQAVEKVLERDLDRHDSTTTQLGFLALLDASTKPLTPGQLAKYSFREQHSVSAQLSRMWRNGLVKKTRSKKDQRVAGITPTPKGKEKLAETKKSGMRQARDLLKSALSEQEMAQFDKLLKKIRDAALEKLDQKAEKLPDGFNIGRFEGGG
jgi:DNA-binding MarR family transcriptional regulator